MINKKRKNVFVAFIFWLGAPLKAVCLVKVLKWSTLKFNSNI